MLPEKRSEISKKVKEWDEKHEHETADCNSLGSLWNILNTHDAVVFFIKRAADELGVSSEELVEWHKEERHESTMNLG